MSAFDSLPSSSIVNSSSGPTDAGQSLTADSTESVAPEPQVSTIYFIAFLIAIIVSWILVDLWTKVIANLAYVTFNLKSSSTMHSFIVAGICTLVFLLYICLIEPVGSDVRFQMLGSVTTAPSIAVHKASHN